MADYNGSDAADQYTGTRQADSIYGNGGDDTLGGAGGDDRISGGIGDDVLAGDDGADVLQGDDGDDRLAGGAGDDVLTGGAGSDTARYDSAAAGVAVSLLIAGAQDTGGAGRDTLSGIENLTGSGFADTLTGTDAANVLDGGGSDDTIVAGDGDDLVYGGDGDDTIDAGAGADLVRGGAGVDTLHGGDGDDVLQIDRVDDLAAGELYDGGAGTDTLVLNFNTASDLSAVTLTGIEAIDQSYFGYDTRLTAAQLDAVTSVSGESFTLTTGGAVTMAGVTINADAFILADAGNSFDLTGATQTYLVTVTGGAGDDTITGGTLADTLSGGGGADVLAGAEGDDLLDGGNGADRMAGGAGDDRYVVDDRGDTVTEAAGGGDDTVASAISYRLGAEVEALVLTGTGAIHGTGNALANAITGNDAANALAGAGGADVLTGAGGDDRLDGGKGGDTLDGGADDDTLVGGAGRDTLTGGTGADTFVFAAGDTGATAHAADLITDFSHADGDRIDLSAIDADTGTDGTQHFTFIGDAAFSGTAGELRASTADGVTYLRGDTDGDGTADLVIALTGTVTLTAGDLILS